MTRKKSNKNRLRKCQMIELVDKDINTTVINIFYMFRKIEEHMSMMRKGDR